MGHVDACCYIRISMNNLKDIHNAQGRQAVHCLVVILGFQWTIWRTYTTTLLFCLAWSGCYIRISMNNLKDIHNIVPKSCLERAVVILGFQWTIWRTYTTGVVSVCGMSRCYIRISMNNLKDIHNGTNRSKEVGVVVILGFQWTIWRTYTTCGVTEAQKRRLLY